MVEREGKVLSGLWGRWGDVVQGLRALGEGLILGDGKGENGGGGKDSEVDGGEGYAAKYRELDTAYKTKRAGILEQYEDACEELVQGVRKDEKVCISRSLYYRRIKSRELTSGCRSTRRSAKSSVISSWRSWRSSLPSWVRATGMRWRR